MECVMTDTSNPADLIRNVMQTTQNYNAKVFQFATANSKATLDYLSKLATTKNPSEIVELSSRHVREQSETLTRQARELTEIAKKLFPKA
jgi:hypothetical protein